MTEYKDKFTLDGRLKPTLGVTRAKVEAADRLLGAALRGDKIADGQFREALTTSDLQFNVAHLITTEFLPQFDEAERTNWNSIAGVREVPDFSPVRLQSILSGNWENISGPGIREGGGAVRVPEGAPYPMVVTNSGQEAMHTGMHKNGFRFAYTWEASIGDTIGFFQNLPTDLLTVALDTENAEVFDALFQGVTSNADMEAYTLPDDTEVPAHSTLTPEAVVAAIMQLQEREVNGRKVGGSSNGYNVLVPVGEKARLEFAIAQRARRIEVVDGLVTYMPFEWPQLGQIEIIEVEGVTGTEWYVLPKVGGLRRPVLELLRLRGYTSPELRVNNATGTYVGGGVVGPFEGSFTNDTIDYRFRYPTGSVLWDDTYVLHSNGTTAP